MEVVKEEKELTADQIQAMKEFREDMQRAEYMAQKLNELMLGRSMTIRQINKLTGLPLSEVQMRMNYLSKFILVQITTAENKEHKYCIVSNVKERITAIAQIMEYTKNEFMLKLADLMQMANILEEKIKEEEKAPPVS